MKPYVPQLLPELKRAILDPIPEVRGVAAKAVSSLLQGNFAFLLHNEATLFLSVLEHMLNLRRTGGEQLG